MRIKMTGLATALSAVLYIMLTQPAIAEELVIVATNETFQEAQEWVDFLKTKEIPVKHIVPGEFSVGNKDKYIVLMGGMDEKDGIRDIVKNLLTEEEFERVVRKSNGKMYIKYILPEGTVSSNSWGEEQNFIIFTGANRVMAAAVRENSKQAWWDELSIWFDIDESPTIPPY